MQFMDFKMPISSSQMLEINRGSQQEAFSVSPSPNATFVIVLVALYGVSRTCDNKNTSLLSGDLSIYNTEVLSACVTSHGFFNNNPTVYEHAKPEKNIVQHPRYLI